MEAMRKSAVELKSIINFKNKLSTPFLILLNEIVNSAKDELIFREFEDLNEKSKK